MNILEIKLKWEELLLNSYKMINNQFNNWPKIGKIII